MVLAERCPNCAAFLPVRQAGVAVRKCQFCDLEVPGDAPRVEVDHHTTREEARELLAHRRHERPAILGKLPEAPPREGVTPGQSIARGGVIFAGVIVGIVVVVGLLVRSSVNKRMEPARRAQAAAKAAEDARTAYARRLQEASAAAGGWKSFDVIAYLPFAKEQVATKLAGAGITALYVPYVRADGRADFSLGDHSAYVQWRSPAASRPPEGTPLGVDVRVRCKLHVNISPTTTYEPSLSEDSISQCRDAILREPRCTPAEIWARAIAEGAPKEAVADLRYHADWDQRDRGDPDTPRRGVWSLHIDDPVGDKDFSEDYPDDCGEEPRRPGAGAATGAPIAQSPEALKVLERLKPILRGCFMGATKEHPEIEAVEVAWRLDLDDRGQPHHVRSITEMDVEGLFQGNMTAIDRDFERCAARMLVREKYPVPAGGAAKAPLFVRVRIQRKGPMLVPIDLPQAYVDELSRGDAGATAP